THPAERGPRRAPTGGPARTRPEPPGPSGTATAAAEGRPAGHPEVPPADGLVRSPGADRHVPPCCSTGSHGPGVHRTCPLGTTLPRRRHRTDPADDDPLAGDEPRPRQGCTTTAHRPHP